MARKGYLFNKEENEKITALLECLRLGMPVYHACQSAGLSDSVFYKYLKQAEIDKENEVKGSKFVDFMDKVKKAQSDFIKNNMAVITKSALKGSWQASAWLLERRCPDEFGLKNLNDKVKEENIVIENDVPTSTNN